MVPEEATARGQGGGGGAAQASGPPHISGSHARKIADNFHRLGDEVLELGKFRWIGLGRLEHIRCGRCWIIIGEDLLPWLGSDALGKAVIGFAEV